MEAQLILKILNMIQAGFSWLSSRGITKDRVQKMLDDAAGGDVTSAQVQAEIDALGGELDDTAGMIGQ